MHHAKKLKSQLVLFGGILLLALITLIALPHVGASTYTRNATSTNAVLPVAEKPKKPLVGHLKTPEKVKAIYMSQCVVGTPGFRAQLVDLIDTTELNAVIIDIKDFSGRLAYSTDNPELKDSVSEDCGARDIEAFIKMLHEKDIYVIGRVTVFQDPYYTKLHPELAVKKASDGSVWKDHKGLSFIDVSAKPYWDHVVEIAKESYRKGFDEINFDYIRYPSDGNMNDIAFISPKPKYEAVEAFFSYLYEHLKEPFDGFEDRPVLSADLFGYTTTNTDDLGIGQVLERALPYFDYVMPMVYPSHYNAGFIGIAKPAAKPYEVVNYSMEEAVRRVRLLNAAAGSTSTSTEVVYLKAQAEKGHGNISTDQLRPWLQDFDLGATYTPEMVRAQMQATYDVGLDSWALWDAGNTYTKGALLPQ
jgi:hypothetical protein